MACSILYMFKIKFIFSFQTFCSTVSLISENDNIQPVIKASNFWFQYDSSLILLFFIYPIISYFWFYLPNPSLIYQLLLYFTITTLVQADINSGLKYSIILPNWPYCLYSYSIKPILPSGACVKFLKHTLITPPLNTLHGLCRALKS